MHLIGSLPEVRDIEDRFCAVTSYQVSKAKVKYFGEVFTPPHIIDKMLNVIPDLSKKNLDLCSGHGQFTIRLLRKLSSQGKGFDVLKYLRTKHFFAELQLESCYKILWIFGTQINLAIGDALQLAALPKNWRGIWLYVKEGVWVNITKIVKSEIYVSLKADIDMFPYDEREEQDFVKMIEEIWHSTM